MWKAGDRTASDLIHCHGQCGTKVHPVCAGYSDDYPPPEDWKCPLCAGDDDDDDMQY